MPVVPRSDADALAVLGKKIPAAIAEEAGHLELARLLRQAAQEQVQNQVAATERLQRRLHADAIVEAKGKLIAAMEDEEVADIEQDIIRKKLGVEPVLHCVLKTFCARCEGRISDADCEVVSRP